MAADFGLEGGAGAGATRDEGTLKREFTARSAFSVAFAFISPVVALYGIYALTFAAAGPSAWWGFLIGLGGQLLVCLVFAELVSRWPFEGSVYQWSRRLSGESQGWFCGWAYMWTLMIAIGSAAYIAAGFVPIVLNTHPLSKWGQIGVALLIVLIGTSINTIGRRGLKILSAAAVGVELVGSIGVGIALLFFHPHQPLSSLFHSHGASYGPGPFVWSGTLAAVAFVGWAFVGFESAGAIAEEVKEPRRAIPKAMLISLLSVGSIVLFSALALTLAIPDYNAVVAGKVADPVADTIAYRLGTGVSRPLFGLFIISFTATFVAAQASASRVMWSFARDDVLPSSNILKRLSKRASLPVPAIIVTAVVASLVILSSVQGKIYGTMVLFSVVGFYVAFAFPVVGALAARVRRRWASGQFSLGRCGMAVTAAASIWVLFEMVNIAWPRGTTQPWYLQYAVLIMLGVIGFLGIIAWASRRDQIRAAGEALESPDAEPVPIGDAGADHAASRGAALADAEISA
jgi:amino acid transporter